MQLAAVIRGVAHLRLDSGEGSSEEAEWLALLHALEIACAAGERDVLLIGDSASVIDQARGIARMRLATGHEQKFVDLAARFNRLRFRRIRRNQNLAGIALDQVRRRSPQR